MKRFFKKLWRAAEMFVHARRDNARLRARKEELTDMAIGDRQIIRLQRQIIDELRTENDRLHAELKRGSRRG